MTRRAAALVASTALLLSMGRALAESPPPTVPTRDVDVTYRMPRPGAEPGAPGLEQRMRWSASDAKERVDSPSPGLYIIVDYRSHRLQTVREADRKVMEVDTAATGVGPGGAAAQPLVRHGEARIAGLDCTEWETRDNAGQTILQCLTPDGVRLRATSGGRVLLEALSVNYGAVDPAAFRIPDGYTRIQPPPRPAPAAPKPAP